MHELSIMQSILDIVVEFAAKNNAGKVTKINLAVGELSGMIPEWMQKYFDFVSEGSVAEKAQLDIEWIPAIMRCKACGEEYRVTRGNFKFDCPKCDAKSEVEIISGREYTLKSIEVN